MDIAFSADDERLRSEVRAFLETNVPVAMRFRFDTIERQAKEAAGWVQKALHSKGWSVPNWPKAHGGPGWTPVQQTIFHAECARVGAPLPSQFGPIMIGPVIYTFGTDVQKAQHLPGIRDGSVFWCQGYSEPGSGSDLASVKTRAVRDGDDYVVNGQKIWTTQAQWADWIFCLVRTDPTAKPQLGISFLLIDMRTPGITVKPIISIDGLHHLNEVFFTDVRVPVGNLVGAENQGWTYAKFLLANERAGLAGTAHLRVLLDHLRIRATDMAAAGSVDFSDFAHQFVELPFRSTRWKRWNAARFVRRRAAPMPERWRCRSNFWARRCSKSLPNWVSNLQGQKPCRWTAFCRRRKCLQTRSITMFPGRC